MPDLVAVVTGAGSGIGRATALGLAGRGLRVCCVGRRAAALEETVCRPLAAANLGAAAVAVAVVIAFPGASHPDVIALAIASTLCAMFAAAQWAVSQSARPDAPPESAGDGPGGQEEGSTWPARS